jgi:predicted small lipoprotein YifL
MRAICLILLLAFLSAACGQKGPLYLPKDKDKPEMTEEGTPKPRNDPK